MSDKKENPEALATFADTARNHGERDKKNPDRADAATKAIPADPKKKDKAAAEVLRAGITKQPGAAQPYVDKVPDRTKPRGQN